MIDYKKIFEDTLQNEFDILAKDAIKTISKMKKAGIKSIPRRYKFSPTCQFGLTINNYYKDDIDWVKGQAFAYTQKIAEINRRSKIKSIDIKIYKPEDDRPEWMPQDKILLVGEITFTR